MYKFIINLFYWLLIKSVESKYDYSLFEVDEAVNKIVIFKLQSSIRQYFTKIFLCINAFEYNPMPKNMTFK